MGKAIKRFFRKFLFTNSAGSEIKAAVKEMIQSDAFRVIERDFRNSLENTYYELMHAKPEDIVERQMKISILVQVWERIYDLAGLEWDYEGHRYIREPEGAEEDRHLDAEIQRMLKKLKESEEVIHAPGNNN